MEETTLKLLIDGGLATVALFSLYINYSLSKDFSKTINNHLDHSTEQGKNLEVAITKLVSFLEVKLK